MRPSPFQRKTALLLYLCKKEKLLPEDSSERNARIKELGGVTRNTLKNWLAGKDRRSSLLKSVSIDVSKIVKEKNPLFEILNEENFLEDVGVMKLGQLLKFSRAECRKEIDQHVSSVMATFSIFSIDRSSVESTWSELGGYYIAYRIESTKIAKKQTGKDINIMAIPIAVRHRLAGNKEMSKEYEKIRAKAHIHSFEGKAKYYEYDGFLTRLDGAGIYHWLFQSRKQVADDMLYITTGNIRRVEHDKSDSRLFLIGSMFSRNQDSPASSEAWPVILEKVDIKSYAERVRAVRDDWDAFDDDDSYFMRTAPDIIASEELDDTLKSLMREANENVRVSRFDF